MAPCWRLKVEEEGEQIEPQSLPCLGSIPGWGLAPQPPIWGAQGVQGIWGHSAMGFPLACTCRGQPVGSCPCVAQGHPHCGVTQAELGCSEHPRRTGCLFLLSSRSAFVAAGAENIQKTHPGCVSYGCRPFPDRFLHSFPVHHSS